jgi:hypothetical protein
MATAEKQQPKQQKKRLPRGKPFTPGQSGNPKGRPPRGQTEAERTREFLDRVDPETGETYGEMLRKKKLELALAGNIQAIESLENRAYGKSVDTVKLETSTQAAPTGYLGLLSVYGIDRGSAIDTSAETIEALPVPEAEAEPVK